MDFRETDKLILDNVILMLRDEKGLSETQLRSLYVIIGCTLGLNDDRVYNLLGNIRAINGKHYLQDDFNAEYGFDHYDDEEDTLDCDDSTETISASHEGYHHSVDDLL